MSKIEKSKTYKRTTLESATILYENVISESFYVKEHTKVKENNIIDLNADIDVFDASYVSCDENGYSYDNNTITGIENWTDFVQHMQPNKNLSYSKTIERVFLDKDKLTIGKYTINKDKRVGKKFFKERRDNNSITLDLKNGYFYDVITSWKASKLEKKVIKKNRFSESKFLYAKFSNDATQIFLNYLQYKFNLPIKTKIFDSLIDWFIKFHQIKVTDNYKKLLISYYPGLTALKKSKGNLVDGVIRNFKLKGNKIRKILNTNDDVNVFSMKFFNSIFDINIFNEIDNEFIDKYFLNDAYEKNYSKHTFLTKVDFGNGQVTYEKLFKEISTGLSFNEQKRILKIIKDSDYELSIHDIIDHFRMKVKIEKATSVPLLIKARNSDEFHIEHALFTKLNGMIDSKYITVITYPEEMIQAIEKPIKIKENIYKIVLLKTNEDYLQEGSYQSHCVGGYVTYASHIVSARLHEIRMTSEYDEKGFNKQSRMRFNENPKDEWELVKKELDYRMKQLGFYNKIAKKEITRVLIDREKLGEMQQNLLETVDYDAVVDEMVAEWI